MDLAPVALATPEASALDVVVEAAEAPKAPMPVAVITLLSSPPTPSTVVSPTPSIILDRAAAELGRLREDLRGADPRLVAGRLELAFGWVRSDASVRAALSQAATAFDEEKLATSQAKAARDTALGDAADARGRWKMLEDELQGLCDELAKEVRDRQEKEKEMKT